MNVHPSTVLVVGATGSIGRHVVDEALLEGYVERALVRDTARSGRVVQDRSRILHKSP